MKIEEGQNLRGCESKYQFLTAYDFIEKNSMTLNLVMTLVITYIFYFEAFEQTLRLRLVSVPVDK